MDNLIGSRICGGNPAGKRKKSDFYPIFVHGEDCFEEVDDG